MNTLTIGQLAHATGTKIETIRVDRTRAHFPAEGLLQQKRSGVHVRNESAE
jgi:hypothetical protein